MTCDEEGFLATKTSLGMTDVVEVARSLQKSRGHGVQRAGLLHVTRYGAQTIAAKLSAVLGKEEGGVGAEGDGGGGGEIVAWRIGGGGVVGGMVGEQGAVAVPVGVKAESPEAGAREAEEVGIVGLVGEVKDDDDIVAGAALVPTMEGENFSGVVDVKNVEILAAKAGCVVEPVAAEPNKVAIEIQDASESRGFGPVERSSIAPRAAFEKFLPLKNHGNAGRGED